MLTQEISFMTNDLADLTFDARKPSCQAPYLPSSPNYIPLSVQSLRSTIQVHVWTSFEFKAPPPPKKKKQNKTKQKKKTKLLPNCFDYISTCMVSIYYSQKRTCWTQKHTHTLEEEAIQLEAQILNSMMTRN